MSKQIQPTGSWGTAVRTDVPPMIPDGVEIPSSIPKEGHDLFQTVVESLQKKNCWCVSFLSQVETYVLTYLKWKRLDKHIQAQLRRSPSAFSEIPTSITKNHNLYLGHLKSLGASLGLNPTAHNSLRMASSIHGKNAPASSGASLPENDGVERFFGSSVTLPIKRA